MTVWIEAFPVTMSFQVRGKLPPFRYGCAVRTDILRRQFKRKKVKTWQSIDSFIVEKVIRHHGGFDETWEIGS